MLIEPTDMPLPGSGPATVLPTTIDKGQISKDYDMFLRLMTAQLKNQDPLQPLDGTEFVAQLAQFSGVEQQIKTNERLDFLLGALTLYLTNVNQVREISIFSAVLLVQSLPFLAAVGLALIERSPLNEFATWRRLTALSTYRPRLPRGRAPSERPPAGGGVGIMS